MTLGDMFNLITFICNKDFAGQIVTPLRFSQILPIANIDHFRWKFGIPEAYQPGRPIANEYLDITLKNTDDMKAFKEILVNTPVTAGVLPYPALYAHRGTISYNFTKTINGVATVLPRPVEVLREDEFASRNGNYTKRPTTKDPIAVVRNDGIHIRPLTITVVDFAYLRWPVTPIFGYILGDGFITYDAVNSTELEWPEDEKIVIMRRCLEYIGVNLREGDILNYANAKLKEG